MSQARGQLTQRIKDKSKEFLGYEISETGLRLTPYLMHTMMDTQIIAIRCCNKADRDILAKWRKAGYLEGGASGLSISKEFWGFICDMVFLGYVDLIE